MDIIRARVFRDGGDVMWGHKTPARAIESILGYLHREDSYQRTVLTVETKSGVMMANVMSFYGISPLGEVALH